MGFLERVASAGPAPRVNSVRAPAPGTGAHAPRVVIVGGGSAALSAALSAGDAGARVTLLERAPQPDRGGNTRHTSSIRTLHAAADGYVTGSYPFDEFWAELVDVSGEDFNRELGELSIRESDSIATWMVAHGARWQAPPKSKRSLSRTNRFFRGGGRSLLNAYYSTAKDAGIEIHYDATVVGLVIEGRHCRGVHVAFGGAGPVLVEADAVVVAAGGFEANREWLTKYWGPAAANFVIRGTPYNDGAMLRLLLDAGACRVGTPKAVHAIAVDARSPAYDAGTSTRLDVVPIGIVVNFNGERFYDEGEDIWPNRYATWGGLIALQPQQKAFAIYDSKVVGETSPSLYPPLQASSVEDLASQMGLDPVKLGEMVGVYNAHCRPDCDFDLSGKDGCGTDGLVPPKSHWARPIDIPPFYGYPLVPGITFTYMGVAVDAKAHVRTDDGAFANLFAAGEIMAGNVLTRGYLPGFGMTLGSVWGRIAGQEAARCSS